MEFFFSAELDDQVGEAWRRVAKPLESELNSALASEDFGPVVTSIGLIPMILPPTWTVGHTERRLWQRAEASADYRLWMPYEAFRDGTDEVRRLLLVHCLLEAVRDLQRKAGARFDGRSLTTAVLRATNIAHGDLVGLPRWPC